MIIVPPGENERILISSSGAQLSVLESKTIIVGKIIDPTDGKEKELHRMMDLACQVNSRTRIHVIHNGNLLINNLVVDPGTAYFPVLRDVSIDQDGGDVFGHSSWWVNAHK